MSIAPCIKALLLLGGSGERFGADLPKQFQLLSGKKIYLHTLDRFISAGRFSEILLVCHPGYVEEIQKDLSSYPDKNIRIVIGGKSRQESSYRGLSHCGDETDYVVIHDAVRPFVTPRIIHENIEAVQSYFAVDTCTGSFDTIVESFQHCKISRIPERRHYLRGQTPQSFSYPLILKAHRSALEAHIQNSSDDCQLVLRLGQPVHIVDGDEHNIKITTELDLFLAEQLMRLKSYDASSNSKDQAFSLKDKVYLIVGGTSGIGEAVQQALSMEGARTHVLSRSSQTYAVDISSEQEIRAVFSRIENEIGKVDGLINSAGLLKIKSFHQLSFNEINELLSVNLHGVIYACRCCQIKPGGHIVNLASSSYTRGRKDYAIYSCAKAGVVNFTQALSEELPQLNVNAVVPKRTMTPLRKASFPSEDEKELLSPQDVANVIVNLLKHKTLTGQIIEVRKKRE